MLFDVLTIGYYNISPNRGLFAGYANLFCFSPLLFYTSHANAIVNRCGVSTLVLTLPETFSWIISGVQTPSGIFPDILILILRLPFFNWEYIYIYIYYA